MVVITAEAYKNAKVNAITVGDRKLFWVKMIDVQDGLGLKIMSDLVRREMCGIFEKKKPSRKRKTKKYKV